MTSAGELLLFIGFVAAISLTGVMIPGPVTAVTVTKGSQQKAAWVLVAVGHGVVEVPLIALIYVGFGRFLVLPEVKTLAGLAGGMVLI